MLWKASLLVVAWVVLSELLVPALITFLYSSDVLSSVEAVREARSEQSLQYFLYRWRNDARWGSLVLIAYFGFAFTIRRPGFAPRWVKGATPGALGAIRVLVCGLLLALTLAERLPSTALLPRDMIHEPGVLAILYALPIGLDRLMASPLALAMLQGVTALLLCLGMLGARTRVVLPLATLAYLVLGAIPRQYSSFYHQGLAPLYLLALLCLAPSADGWSLDRVARRAAGLPVPAARRRRPVYGWARYACWTLLALFYFQSGASKLRRSGFAWLEPDSLRTIVARDTLQPMSFDWEAGLGLVAAPDLLVALLALGAVAVELLFPLALFSPLARKVWPLAAVGLHLGILLMQRILFLDLMALQLIFWSGRCWRRWRASRRHRPRRASPNGPLWLDRAAGWLCGVPAADFDTRSSAPMVQQLWKRRIRRFAALLLFLWAVRIESYPLTAWQMYSSAKDAGAVDYQRVVASFDSGNERRAPLDLGIAALDRPLVAGTRYRRLLERSFDRGDERRVARELLRTSAGRANRSLPDGERIVEIRVERWLWNLRSDQPDRGELVDRYFVAVE